MWRIYRNTGNIEGDNNYKKALNLATAEMRKSKWSFEQKFASKQKVRDKVGPLKNSAGNVISDGFQMAENLNEYFCSVFTKEDISSLPLPARKFEGDQSQNLGQLFITPEMITKTIKMMKKKSPGVDGIKPKLLKETVSEISMPLANICNIRLKEGIVPAEWKEANEKPLFKKGLRSKTENYRPVSLSSVLCKLLETFIKDHMVDFLVKNKLITKSQHGFLKARSYLTNLLCFLKILLIG